MTGVVTNLMCVFCAIPYANSQTFNAFMESLWPQAQANGISRATFDNATSGLQLDSEVLALSLKQPEYVRPVGSYVDAMVSDARVAQGAGLSRTLSAILDRAEKTFGIDRYVVLAIWGVETSFGRIAGNKDVFRSLATLAHARYRDDFFRDEFHAALRIVQDNHISRSQMRGSWAGAMGQAQFIPSSFLKFAVDFSNDGRRDIWSNVPDVVGSIANYLHKSGWHRGLAWGHEVILPPGFDYMRSRASFSKWKEIGVRRADGQSSLPDHGDAVILFPSGSAGPAFLVTVNYLAIKAYNNSDAYAVAVGHLADRMRGGGKMSASWPANESPLPRPDRMALQRKLAQLGYDVKNFQGQIDFELRDSIRDIQAKLGMRPDGHPNSELLKRVLSMPANRP